MFHSLSLVLHVLLCDSLFSPSSQLSVRCVCKSHAPHLIIHLHYPDVTTINPCSIEGLFTRIQSDVRRTVPSCNEQRDWLNIFFWYCSNLVYPIYLIPNDGHFWCHSSGLPICCLVRNKIWFVFSVVIPLRHRLSSISTSQSRCARMIRGSTL